jgi:uncharacterized protein YutE (UPF0331/DUF86 family)
MGDRVVMLRRSRCSDQSKGSLITLAQAGVPPAEITGLTVAMVGFHNIAVHDYQTVDLPKVRGIVEKELNDLSAFSKTTLAADPNT